MLSESVTVMVRGLKLSVSLPAPAATRTSRMPFLSSSMRAASLPVQSVEVGMRLYFPNTECTRALAQAASSRQGRIRMPDAR